MIHVDALDFSEWHSEEVMFLLTLSVVYLALNKLVDHATMVISLICISKEDNQTYWKEK